MFQDLQLIVLVVFGALDGILASCVMVHFYVYIYKMAVGVYVWYTGQKFPIDVLPLFMILYVTHVLFVSFHYICFSWKYYMNQCCLIIKTHSLGGKFTKNAHDIYSCYKFQNLKIYNLVLSPRCQWENPWSSQRPPFSKWTNFNPIIDM